MPRAATAALALVAVGCASIGSYETANTLGEGRYQLAVEPAYEISTGGGNAATLVRFDIAARYGVTDRVDISARAGSSFLELGAKFQITDPWDRSVAVSIGPRLGGFVAPGGAIAGVNATLPILLGFGFGEGNQFVIGPKLLNFLFFDSVDRPLDVLAAGGTIGFSFKLGDNIRLMPEFGFAAPLVRHTSNSNGDPATTAPGAGAVYQVGIGLLAGGDRRPRPRTARRQRAVRARERSHRAQLQRRRRCG